MASDGGGPDRRVGSEGRTPTAGRVARRAGAVLLALGVAAGVLSLLLFFDDGDLRDLGALRTTSATVAERDDTRRGPDYLEVDYTPAGQREMSGRIPVEDEVDAAVGDVIEVAYRAEEPTRVRTVVGWSPAWVYAAINGSLAAAIGLPALVFGLVSRARSGRFEAGAPLPATTHDQGLGERVVRSVSWMPLAPVGLGLVVGALFGVLIAVVRDELLIGVGVGAGFIVLFGSFGGALYWYYGRDGVWESDTELVVRRRGRQRRWPWTQVRELGVAVKDNMVHPVARVDDGDIDGRIGPGWLILAKPLLGPAAKYTATRRMEALAAGHELPFTEGLGSGDISDGLL